MALSVFSAVGLDDRVVDTENKWLEPVFFVSALFRVEFGKKELSDEQ